MKKLVRKKIIAVFLLLILIALGVHFYFNSVFIPVKLKEILTNKAKVVLRRDLTIGSVDYTLTRGVIVSDLVIYQRSDKEKPLLKIGETCFTILIPNIFNINKVVIPSLTIKDAEIYLIKKGENKWNFSDLIKKKDKKKAVPSFLMGKISIDNADISITDKTAAEEISWVFKNTNFSARLSASKGIKYSLETSIPEDAFVFKAKGSYRLLLKKITSEAVIKNLNVQKYIDTFYKNENFVLNAGFIDNADLYLTFAGKKLTAEGKSAIGIDLNIADKNIIKGYIYSDDVAFSIDKEAIDIKNELKIKDADCTFNKDTILKGNFSLSNLNFKKKKDSIILNSDLSSTKTYLGIAKNFSISGDIQSNPVSFIYKKGSHTIKTSLDIKNSEINIAEKTRLKGNFIAKNTSVEIIEKTSVEVKSNIRSDGTPFTINNAITVKGDPLIDLALKITHENSKGLTYSGRISSTKTSVSGIPRVENISSINGNIDFKTDHLKTEKVVFNTLNTDVHLAGEMSDFKNLILNITAGSKDVELSNLIPVFKEKLAKAGITPKGKSSVNIKYQGPMLSHKEADLNINAELMDVSLSGKILKGGIKNINGPLKYSGKTLTWDNLKGTFKGNEYTLSGELVNALSPMINTSLSGNNINLTSKIKIGRGAFSIPALAGTFHNTNFDIKGDVTLIKDSDPDLDMKGQIRLDLSDIDKFIPKLKSKIKKLDPKGVLSTNFLFRGKASDYKKATFSADANSPELSLAGFSFNKIVAKLVQGDTPFAKLEASADTYHGTLALITLADFKNESSPFRVSVQLQNVELAEIIKHTKWKEKEISGKLSFASDVSGLSSDLDAIKGTGSIIVKDGHLWDFALLKGIFSVLVVSDLGEITFTDAQGNFFIQDKRINTNDFMLLSNALDLSAQGWVDFDKNIDFKIKPDFKESSIISAQSPVQKSTSTILSQAGDYFFIIATGTLDNPKIKLDTLPTRILQDTTGVIKDIISEGLKGLLNEIQ